MVSPKLAESSSKDHPLEELVVGDLVKFRSSSFLGEAAASRYSSHGIVIRIRHTPKSVPNSVMRSAYTVIWSNGNETTEWRCYLKKLS